MQHKSVFCTLPYTRMRITSEGNVGFCCIHKPIIGNILNDDFESIWNGPIANEIRDTTERNQLHNSCAGRNCPHEHSSRHYADIVENKFPLRIDIDLPNTHCNVGGTQPSETSKACIMCPRSSIYFRPEIDRTLEICERIKPYLRYVSYIHVQGISEAFWKNKLFQILDALDFEPHKNRIEFSTFTNGTIFNKKVRHEYLRRCPLSRTYVSIDAASSETYRKIRIIDAFDTVIRNLMDFGSERLRTNKLVCANNINIFNVSEVEGMIDIANKAGADWVEFNSTDANDNEMVQFVANSDNAHLFIEAEEKIKRKCAHINMKYHILKALDTPSRANINFVKLNEVT